MIEVSEAPGSFFEAYKRVESWIPKIRGVLCACFKLGVCETS
jgi:hypothetical protein